MTDFDARAREIFHSWVAVCFCEECRKLGKSIKVELLNQASTALRCAYEEGRVDAEHKALMTLAGLLLSNGGKLGIQHGIMVDLDNNVFIRRWTDELSLTEWYEANLKTKKG